MQVPFLKVWLATTTVLCSVATLTPAGAQTAAQMDAIQQQINALQAELKKMKADMAKRDEQLRAAQQQAAQARAEAKQAQTNAQQAQSNAQQAESSATEAKQQSAAAQTAVATTVAAAPAQPPAAATLTMPNGRPTFTSADGKWSVSMGLQLQFDFGGYFTGNNPNQNATAQLAPFNQTLRRGRIPLQFRYDDFMAAITPDFGGTPDGNVSLYEANFNYTGLKPLTLTVGYFKPWLTLADSTSSNDFLLLERPSIEQIAVNVAAGDTRAVFGGRAYGDQWFTATYLTGQKWGSQQTTVPNYTQTGATTRLAGRPLTGDDYDVHTGFSLSDAFRLTRNPPTGGVGGQTTSLSDYPEMRVDPVKLINTGNISNADSVYTWGPEFGFRWKKFLIQGEYTQIGVQRSGVSSSPIPNLTFNGGYVEGSWVITGETRKYDPASAAFQRPVPVQNFSVKDGTWGAWELAARYSATNLNSNVTRGLSQTKTGGVFGGYQQIWAVGLNWYWNRNYKIMFDYEIANIDRLNSSGTTQVGQNFQAALVRLQAAY
jgi:phosphate-selective porin OprO/OprP